MTRLREYWSTSVHCQRCSLYSSLDPAHLFILRATRFRVPATLRTYSSATGHSAYPRVGSRRRVREPRFLSQCPLRKSLSHTRSCSPFHLFRACYLPRQTPHTPPPHPHH